MPDSNKAHTIVKEQLQISDDDLPWIWFYDLQQGGFPIESTETYKTSKILAYRNINTREDLRKKKAMNKQGKLLCLPWKIVGSDTADILLCNN